MAPGKGNARWSLLSCDHVVASQEHQMLLYSDPGPFTRMLTGKEPYLSKQRLCHGPYAFLPVLSL